jgi:predicted metal-dependent phosphoesterase TrpH
MDADIKADLHCHSIYSDGTLSPSEVVDLAYENEVELFALSDHDSLVGLQEARERCQQYDITMLDAVEISITWEYQKSHSIHIVGLNIDPNNAQLQSVLKTNQAYRKERSEQMLSKLQSLGIEIDNELANMIPENGLITRTHIARAMVQAGVVNKMDKAFKKFLGKGKKAYVGGDWVSLQEGVDAINQAGGIAIIAHPMRYRLGATKLDVLVQDFVSFGGKGLEVVTATQDVNQQARCVQLANQYGLVASIGSDFHSLDQPWAILGRCPNLPKTVTPVWQALG